MDVLGNTAAMETRRYNCSKQFAVSYANGYYRIFSLYKSEGKHKLDVCWFISKMFLCILFVKQCHFVSSASSDTAESIITPLRTPLPSALDMTWTIFWMSSKLSKVISSFCKHSGASRHLSLFFEHFSLTASLLSGILGILVLCTAIYFNCLDKVSGLINGCVWEIPWAKFLHWRSFQFCLALTGAGGSPALISVVQLTGC